MTYLSPHSVTPIFTLSSVSGENLDLLKVFFNILPPLSNSKEQEELMQQLTEFQVQSHSNQHPYVVWTLDVTSCQIDVFLQVDEIYSVPDVGTVVGGTLYRSVHICCVNLDCLSV